MHRDVLGALTVVDEPQRSTAAQRCQRDVSPAGEGACREALQHMEGMRQHRRK